MKHAIIDIGSNSMRLTVYKVNGNHFKILFKEKSMTGLAGYVDNGILSLEGINCACTDLLSFKEILDSLEIHHVVVLATASLRNIQNTDEAITAIKASTGFNVEVLTGDAEAFYSFSGAMHDVSLESGAFVDIGGGSTEVLTFDNGQPINKISYPVGSLRLYKDCVKNILPGEGSIKKIQQVLTTEIDKNPWFSFDQRSTLMGVGGTARAILKLTQKAYNLSADCNHIKIKQLNEICNLLCAKDREMIQLLLRVKPERIHTMIPGIMILDHISKKFNATDFVVCKYGIREGYLCQKILKQQN